MIHQKVIGIDLAKHIFFLFDINHKGRSIERKNFCAINYLAA